MRERNTAAPELPSLDVALEQVRLDGAIFFRGEFTEGWAFESPLAEIAGLMRPGAVRMILFHIVAVGTCWVSVVNGERHWAQQGDVIVLPYGDDYAMGGRDLEADLVPILTLVSPPPWDRLPLLRHGAGGDRTDIVCGYLYSDDPLFDPAMRVFPPVFVVRPPPGPTAIWVASSVDYALTATRPDAPTRPPSTRLHELGDRVQDGAGWHGHDHETCHRRPSAVHAHTWPAHSVRLHPVTLSANDHHA